ncbi:MAG: hypothetical protein A2Y45_01010 [Tenericutes bacterium GWC2_34_14]|nr:MAG: hypothetical protein A2Z84_01455 [Tenericutes bacterium GWA2_35_7]OHE29477.1 MAG: hypothetical protein A2Y45_01010 [Tenericutes bacterium GWC2_34_14]OHE34573.1 MAG: hypothetical protein A2012_08630 [Tenericutes bacterium GWE2_34_108]OHE35930.1 MAG: hypothetical protein A2Y46_03335 [Tenericutes bacterium GWF1_35_14]OHE38984.1 MAG: hypothetical protein A2Y44_06595 [Tenericutes bacterium GWF2_35_184]OHE41809.1 MAG: hypothetical protein A3K26_06855 [Tenericutes bacterium RIFOXYA12_FULL_35_
MSTNLIKLEEAGKRYIPHRFSIDVTEKDIILVSGGNGSGKTTLLMLVLGFIYPDTGLVTKRKLKIGYVPEKVSLPPFVGVLEYLETYARIKKSQLDMDLIHYFQIPIDKTMYELSKGNQQKVSIMCALMGKPHLVVLDEPLSGLDLEMSNRLIDVIKRYYLKGCSFIISTHQPDLFREFATKHLQL